MSLPGISGVSGPSWATTSPASAPNQPPVRSPVAKQHQELERAAAMMEGIFFRQMLKVMRETVPESSLFGDNLGQNIYQQLFDESIADEASKGSGIGLRQVLLEQLSGIRGSSSVTPSALTAQRASATFQRVAALTPGPKIDGVAFEAPLRPERVALKDPDGRLAWPLAGGAAAETLDPAGFIPARPGEAVHASGSGQIIAANQDTLLIDHGQGRRTYYSGLGQVLAQVGDLVLRGQDIGTAGSQGSVRFGVQQDQHALDPNEIKELINTGTSSKKELKLGTYRPLSKTEAEL